MLSIWKKPWFLGGMAVVIVGGGAIIFAASRNNVQESVEVRRGSISREVSISGKVTPAKELSLGFEKSGKIAGVYRDIGEHVYAGETIVSLASGDLAAQLDSALANITAAEAKLDELKRGARAEEIAIKQAALEEAKQNLVTTYAGIPNILENAYINADDAVRKQTDALFIQDEELNATLSFRTFDLQAEIDAQNSRVISRNELNAWRSELAALPASAATAEFDQALLNAGSHLAKIQIFLKHLSDALVRQSNLSAATVTVYQTNLTAARAEVSASLSSITSAKQAVASQNLAVKQAENNLALTKAGSTPEMIRAQEAQVSSAKASADQIRAEIGKTVIRSPISGIVTKQNAKTGQIVTPGTVLVGIISDADFDIESNIPETDIGRIKLGNNVSITLDAFPAESFNGKVSFIDPAETIVDGVVNFKVKISFDTNDKRIKSGLTANLEIETQRKDGVLILPQSALVQNENGAFAEKVVDGKTETVLVKLGIQGREGTVEILSGLDEGDKVLLSEKP